MSSAAPRILICHGWLQNGEVLRNRIKPWVRKLKDYQLVFATAPHPVPAESAGEREDARTWWFYTSNPRDASGALRSDKVTYMKWDESRAELGRLWREQGPFSVVCGFSQGAVVVHQLLTELQHVREGGEAAAVHGWGEAEAAIVASPPACAILCAGFPSRHTHGQREGELIHTPSLHIASEGDTTVPAALQRELMSHFDPSTAQLLLHDKGHSMPVASAPLSTVLAFIQKHTGGAVAAAASAAQGGAGSGGGGGGGGSGGGDETPASEGAAEQ